MTTTAATIKAFRDRAEALRITYTTAPIWGVSGDWQRAYDEDGVCYRLKDAEADAWYAARFRRAADWLEEHASAATLAALYPHISIR